MGRSTILRILQVSMEPKRIKSRNDPEAQIRDDIKTFLSNRGWYVKTTHGGMFQAGFPDLWATHKHYGGKWLEVKLPGMRGSVFTKAQIECFPQLVAHGTPIWIVTEASQSMLNLITNNKHGNFQEYFSIYLAKSRT